MEKTDKRKLRGQSKVLAVQRCALELFATHGLEKVTMDEIAAQAKVAKATLYKYFGSKEELYDAVVNLYVDQVLAETEAIFKGNLPFQDKLAFVLLNKVAASHVVTWEYLARILAVDGPLAERTGQRIETKLKALMRVFVEDGKARGFIDDAIPFEVFYLYSQVVRTGFQIKMPQIRTALSGDASVDQLVHLYFYGILKSPPKTRARR